ncbi:MAG: sulfate adenylyltransferase [Candidatus Eremiobacteraeota bacterium]|nr:sulfate adenylyltransferase [Candidatus Eremiobacteraeota bacterium]
MTTTLPPAHGGPLIQRAIPNNEVEHARATAARLQRVPLSDRSVCDVVCIGIGAYSPLEGFMSSAQYDSVLQSMRLPNGLVWPVPITLPVSSDVRTGSRIALEASGEIVAIMDVSEIYEADPEQEAVAVYGTADRAHPGVAALDAAPRTLAAGSITLLDVPDFGFPDEFLTPQETRARFERLGWKTIVGFQTRNPVHRAHEYLQKVALEIVDGLLLHPLVGLTKDDDIAAGIRMDCYRRLLEKYYPPKRALLCIFPAAMRYAGPREAVLHAIARKNYGCSHFIVGRDHAGVGSYYGSFDAQAIFDGIEDELGIVILRFDNASWCRLCAGMVTDKTCPHPGADRVNLSGTKLREMLRAGERPPAEVTRTEIADILIEAMAPARKG